MKSSPKGAADSLTTAADFYDFTRSLLIDARAKRDMSLMRRVKIRIDSKRFLALSEGRQEDLLVLYSAAMMETGMNLP